VKCVAWGTRKYVARESLTRETSLLSRVPCFLAPYGYFSSTGWKVFFFLEANTKAIRFILLQFCPSVLLVAFEYLFSLLFSVLINPMPFQSVISSRHPVTDLVFAELALYCFSRPRNSQLLTFPRRSRY